MRLFSVYCLLILLIASCAEDEPLYYPYVESDVLASVKYEVTGSAQIASIATYNKDLQPQQFSNMSIPWEYTFPNKIPRGTFLSLAAQHPHDNASIIVTILRDGHVFLTDTSYGQYAKAEVSGRL